jgi:hypothetical protein
MRSVGGALVIQAWRRSEEEGRGDEQGGWENQKRGFAKATPGVTARKSQKEYVPRWLILTKPEIT